MEENLSHWRQRPRAATALLRDLGRRERAALARQVLEAMALAQLEAPRLLDCPVRAEVNIFHYGALMAAQERQGDWQGASQLLRRMLRRQVTPDVVTLNAAISCCSKASAWPQALVLLQELGEKADVVSFNGAISGCEWLQVPLALPRGLFGMWGPGSRSWRRWGGESSCPTALRAS